MNLQEIFTAACDSLRSNGNPYGSFSERRWGWCNPRNPNERCAIARFIEGNNSFEIIHNLIKSYGSESILHHPMILAITDLFDYSPISCNNKEFLELEFQYMADQYNLIYTAPQVEINTLETI